MSTFTCHVVIIGAGLGGLAAGVAILKAGHCVSILERAPTLGEVISIAKISLRDGSIRICVLSRCIHADNSIYRSAPVYNFLRTQLVSSKDGEFSSA
jgi:heterodisulfide reductase subunit A-like polyferredoxin